MNRVQEQRTTWDLLGSVVTEGQFEEDVFCQVQRMKKTQEYPNQGGYENKNTWKYLKDWNDYVIQGYWQEMRLARNEVSEMGPEAGSGWDEKMENLEWL